MIQIRQIKVSVLKDTKEELINKICKKIYCKKEDIIEYKIVKKSIDARDKNNIFFVYEVSIKCLGEGKILKKSSSSDVFLLQEKKYEFPLHGSLLLEKRPIVIGSGPAGLFCSYLLAEEGYQPILLERGEKIEDRVKTVEDFFQKNILKENSNIQFGEGGAGTFSDGKLNTATKDNVRGKKVLEIFVENGAPSEILYEQNPHIGTDILRKVIINMRNKIISLKGEFHYNSCVTDFIIEKDTIKGVIVNQKEKYYSDVVVLAIGHSARDTFYKLKEYPVKMISKNFAVGLRIEHPKELIDEAMYHKFKKVLGSASYKLTYQTKDNRGVYTFCMCPGGFVVNASSEKERICCNGMSNYKRDEKNSNSAIVVTVTPKDFGEDIFKGLEFQRELEHLAYVEGKGYLPVQLYKDYKDNKESTSFGEYEPNTKGKVTLANLNKVLPKYINDSIKEALPEFGKKIKGFDREDAILIGVETRTSSPIVIVRDDQYNSTIKGLYPCGEGAGYAGGITTAAIDGIKIAEEIAKKYEYRIEL